MGRSRGRTMGGVARDPSIQVECNDIGWLSRCRVGRIKDVGLIHSLKDAFLVEGLVSLNVRYMGETW